MMEAPQQLRGFGEYISPIGRTSFPTRRDPPESGFVSHLVKADENSCDSLRMRFSVNLYLFFVRMDRSHRLSEK
jgi:hypothetical protein